MIALFNNEKTLIGYSNQRAPGIKFYKDLGDDFDTNKFFWDGDYDTGSIKPVGFVRLNQFELEEKFINRTKALWATEISHLLCIKQLTKLAEKLDCFDPEFKKMSDEIMPLIEYYDETIKFLKEHTRLDSKETIYAKHSSILKD